VSSGDLSRRIAAGSITGGMKIKAQCILEALEGGVERVHILDGRQPHTVIAELFTDRGVGTLVTRNGPSRTVDQGSGP
jgi:acetylglutamate kinase